HWFNPLGRYGWLAMRRDQEAACDARVMASAPKETRALYANVIASFAAGPNVALAAPMACPVLGDKSIIQRLRNLKMNDESSNSKSRKLASRLMLGTAVLALPLTASVTYAEGLIPEAPATPLAAPLAAPVAAAAPVAPAAPTVAGLVQAAPDVDADVNVDVDDDTVFAIVTVDPDTGERKTVDLKGKKTFRFKAKDGDENVFVLKGKGMDKEAMMKWVEKSEGSFDFKELSENMKELRIELRDLEDLEDLEDLKEIEKEVRRVRVINKGKGIDDAQMEIIIKEMREGLADAREATKEARIQLRALAESDEWREAMKEAEGRTIVTMSCDNDSDEVATSVEREDGRTEVMICQTRVMAQALKGLEEARAAIAENEEMTSEVRKEILKELDSQIKEWRKDSKKVK
ncbi:MAG: hypothetical protein HRT64_13210, partial [Erythrobacter sp.]|nr:hypothetical protein [Erythrobacter sp.]